MKITLLFFFSFVTSLLWCQKIASIDFENLKKSKTEFVAAQLNVSIGDSVSLDLIETNAQFLRDLNLFLSVDYTIDTLPNSDVSISYIFNEAISIYPIFSIAGFKNQLNLQLGAADINFLGKGNTIGVIYQFYDRHSIFFYQNSPRHLNNRTGHEFSVGRKSTVEPLYFNDHTANFNFDNYHVSLGGNLWLNRYLKLNLGGMYMFEQYTNVDSTFDIGNKVFENREQFSFNKIQIRSSVSYRRIQYLFERRSGFAATIFAENIQTSGNPLASFFKGTVMANCFIPLFKRGNLTLQHKFGLATNNFSPFAPFVIDGYLNVRGSGNRIARGTGELIFNTEYLHTLWKHPWFYLQANSFVDIGMLRPAGGVINEFADNAFYYGGLGLRLQSRKFYNTILRVDYGFNLNHIADNGLTFGFGHFF